MTDDAQFGLMLQGTNVKRDVELAKYADTHGAHSIWVLETRLVSDAIGPMAVYAAATTKVQVGSAVLPLWTRNPALLASTFATLDLLAPGRIIMGLGAWWEPLATRVGVKRRQSVTAMREVIESVRMLLAMGGEVNYEGQYVQMHNLYLDHGGTTPHCVQSYIGAVGANMLQLSGRIADGAVINSNHTTSAVRKAVEQIQIGADSAGRSLGAIGRMKILPVKVSRDKKTILNSMKPRLALYLAQQPHIEGPSEADPELVKRIKQIIHWPATKDEALRGAAFIADDLVDSLGCYGDEDEVKSRLHEYRRAGMTAPIVPEATPETIDFLAKGGW
ncbi:LLM class flavin-dependent oxidoreductase [SAR202 cluster bacterium AD-804-J14_MRT_500m]|nr:LLM class flavin-dependent oxidoreductase [SAR202 cluster bacterium AD-804-J14_MRT_500m]